MGVRTALALPMVASMYYTVLCFLADPADLTVEYICEIYSKQRNHPTKGDNILKR